MLLKSLKIKDFRQFKGIQKIDFSMDKFQNVTIVMGDNGTGKTTLAQAFTWCLYGETSFEDKILLCRSTSLKMQPESEENVRAEISLIHNEIEYTIISDQKYRKDINNVIKPIGQRSFQIAFKNEDGTRDFINQLETDMRMKEILPKELSKYFFFDGERIESMSKEIKRGRSQEFANAVKSLLGLSAYTAALTHLHGRGNNNVLSVYEHSYDATSNNKIAEYSNKLAEISENIDKIDNRILEIDAEIEITQDKISNLTERIAKNKSSEELARQKADLKKKYDNTDLLRNSQIKSLLQSFNSFAPSYFSKRLIKDSLELLSSAEKLDKGVPNINDETIRYLINRKKCICGKEIIVGNDAFIELTKLLEYIPPKSIGNLISEFINTCDTKSKFVKDYFEDFKNKFKTIREIDEEKIDYKDLIDKIDKQLENLESVGGLQAELSQYEKHLNELQSEIRSISQEKGVYLTKQKDLEAYRKELANKDNSNRKIEIYKAYTKYIYEDLFNKYSIEESRMRTNLQNEINEIFRNIYNGGFSLSLDERYNIQINVIDQSADIFDDVETSTAQNISIIFAFIAGVIKLARKSQEDSNILLTSEPYPLIMDAPLSAFDKKRIKTVCDILPEVAEQVIIFIKDTDGDLVNEFLGNKVGNRFYIDKYNEFEASII